MKRPRLTRYLPAAAGYLGVCFMLLPLLAVVPISFTPKRHLSMPEGEYSLRHYAELLTNQVWQSGILTSVVIGLIVAAITTVIAVLFAVGIWYAKSRYTRLLVGAALMPMAVPPIISALTLYFFTTRTSIYDSYPGVIVAHTVLAIPYAVVTLLVALSQIDPNLERAARNLGASLTQTTCLVILPNIRFGILASFTLAFVLSWEEISVTLFVTSLDVITLPRLMWSGLRESIDPIIAAIAVVVIALSALCALIGLRREK